MKTLEGFAGWLVEHDKRIMEARLKKEKGALRKEMQRLEAERDRMRDYLHRLEALIEKQEELASTLSKISEGGA